jgi:hypothetical protein
VAQGEGPEFKLQYSKKQKTKKKTSTVDQQEGASVWQTGAV